MRKIEHKLLNHFYKMPMSRFHVRELGKMTRLDNKTVMKYLKRFVKEKLIIRKKEKFHYPYYEANRLSRIYRYEKSSLIIKNIIKSGLIEYLEDKIHPKLIVLFGSMQKGTYHKKSDIDLFIKADYKTINLSRYERKLGYRINLLFEKDFKRLSKGLLQNIYNGYALSGNLEVA